MDIVKKAGKKTVVYILILMGIVLFTLMSFFMKTIGWGGLIFTGVGGLIFIFLQMNEAKNNIKSSAVHNIQKAEEAVKSRQWQSALHYFTEALFFEPTNFEAQMGIGYCRREMLEYHKAIEEYKKALEMKPNSIQALFLLGVCYYEERKMDDALETFKRVLNLKPNYPEVGLFLGDIMKLKNDEQSALKYYQQYLEKGGGNEKVRRTLLEKIVSLSVDCDPAYKEELDAMINIEERKRQEEEKIKAEVMQEKIDTQMSRPVIEETPEEEDGEEPEETEDEGEEKEEEEETSPVEDSISGTKLSPLDMMKEENDEIEFKSPVFPIEAQEEIAYLNNQSQGQKNNQSKNLTKKEEDYTVEKIDVLHPWELDE